MKTRISLTILFFCVLFINQGFAQINLRWTRSFYESSNPANEDYAKRVIVDFAGNIIVGGSVKPIDDLEDFAVIKYSPNGNILWSQTFSLDVPTVYTSSEALTDMYVDASGNIFLAGLRSWYDSGISDFRYYYLIVAYNSSGGLMWYTLDSYPYASITQAFITGDAAGNIYIGADRFNSEAVTADLYAAKFSSLGVKQWGNSYDYNSYWEYIKGIAVDNSGNVYLCGSGTVYLTTSTKMLLAKFNNAGSFQWAKEYSLGGQANSVAIGPDNNPVIVGYAHNRDSAYVMKFSTLGAILWMTPYSPTEGYDEYNDVKIDASGNVYASGYTTLDNTGYGVLTSKFNSSGTALWNSVYKGPRYPSVGTEQGKRLVLDQLNDPCVVSIGNTNVTRGFDYVTLKYNGESGTQIYAIRLDGGQNMQESAVDIAVDDDLNIYLTGAATSVVVNAVDIFTVKYSVPTYTIVRTVTGAALVVFSVLGPHPGKVNDNKNINAYGNVAAINFTAVTGSDSVTCNFSTTPVEDTSFVAAPPTKISSYSWTFTQGGAITSFSGQVRFDYTQIDNAGISNPNNVSIYYRATPGVGAFTELATTVSGTELRANITSFGEFILGSNTEALPVELISFSSSIEKNSVRLHWSTSSEINNNHFEIERSIEQSSWSNLGSVKGSGNSNSTKDYSFLDNNPLFVKSFYRLKQVDNNGEFKYSNIIEVSGIPLTYSLAQNYPNPFNPSTNINYSIPTSGNVKLTVFNAIGQVVNVLENGFKEAGVYNVAFNASGITSGVYFYKLESGSFTQLHKMLLIK